MSTILMILAIVLTCSILAGMGFWYAMRHRPPLAKPLPFISPPCRKLSPQEREAVDKYVAALEKQLSTPVTTHKRSASERLTLTAQSNNVYPVTRAITRYGLSTDDPHKWRYYLDEVEVHLPPLWEQYITDENYVELIRTQSIPLVISLNGHSLVDYAVDQQSLPVLMRPVSTNASIRKAETENVELLQVRKETPEEYRLSRPDGTREAVTISLAFLLFFFSLLVPATLMIWLVLTGTLMIGASLWLLYRIPGERGLRDIHCLRGAPKRWGLFSESNQEQSNITLGIIDLAYPPHWQPYVAHDLGQVTDVEIYLNRQVVRQGRFLSLQDEVKNFPIQRWRKNVVLACGSLLVLTMLVTWIPLTMPIKLSLAWARGTDSLEVSSVDKLSNVALNIGDNLKVSGTGMCSVPDNYQSNRSYAYMPFDCSAIYWNNATPLPQPQSDIIDKAAALLETTTKQLHPETNTDPKLNPQLASAIQKSGMILLDDFSDLVMKTQDLCNQPQDCMRLKNALVNLGNAKDWEALMRRADSGQLNGMNVLLRPVSAEALENLVNTATSTFFFRETRRAAENLNSPPPGGFLIVSDEGRQLVNQPQPTVSLFDLDPPSQWRELQRLSTVLLHTPFSASGIITSISTDANGTRHIVLHNEPDAMAQWRYLGTVLLLLMLLTCGIINGLLALRRMHRNRQRMIDIQQYYEKCFNHNLGTLQGVRSIF
ncbi:intracellular growth attenuator family protein [Pantoea eucalypti]|uniref:Intracellular growth attenuator family protein n=2 Tax=Pantoea eucalypti TaxID=470933 RepID=A0ABY2ZEP5_9GAMM|nr:MULTISPECIES: intracellular growth attenuator family protein [Pantoea]PQL26986.1 intracellular growth attenuator family protein [Pantoea ananatis]QXG54919.1 intracellular growth attenuator family protein [Pantoea jilinensis]AWP31399.1 Intracellular growth attenuator protein igaA [Pantoea vagans]MBD9554163.1 intracellular growth attenuator family protein [Pantoea sp. PNT01]MCD2358284.1 intracellular growth attenuator family protein [Pantoea sp. MHSD4]